MPKTKDKGPKTNTNWNFFSHHGFRYAKGAMTLLDAKPVDLAREHRRRAIISISISVLVLLIFFAWYFRFWPEERIANRFFSALETQNYALAYGIYFHDTNWQQHPQEHSQYPYNEFYADWGPGGEWGLIKSYKVEASGNCPGGGTGVVVQLVVNGRSERARVYVDKKDKTISTPPC
jgi:hypothetical protein